jgi:dienelactone hydrolase
MLRYYPGSDSSTTASYAPKPFWIQANQGLQSNPLVDCISMAHPSLLDKQEIEAVGVPTQILAPETDTQLTPELKEFCNKTIPALGVEYDYQYFPGLAHGFATRGDMTNPLQKKGLERAKNAAVHWFWQHLHE